MVTDDVKKVLDHGWINLYDHMGNDHTIVNMARQSFGKNDLRPAAQQTEPLGKKDTGLVRFLMRQRHGTPFEGVVFTFNVKCPIFIAREWMRHRIGSFNEYSGRYSKMISEFYVPRPEEVREQFGKPGAYEYRPIYYPAGQRAEEIFASSTVEAWDYYDELLAMGVAKEQARFVLPVNIYTQFTWVVNLRSLFNFISLRSDPTAMHEIRQYSKSIEMQIAYVVPVAYSEFVRHGRVAP